MQQILCEGKINDTYLFISRRILFLDANFDCQQAKFFPHSDNCFIVAIDCCSHNSDRLEKEKVMIRLEIKGQDGEWSELLADSPMEAINELIEIIQREGAIFALEWTKIKPHVEF